MTGPRRASPLHAARASAGALYAGALVLAAIAIPHPVVLGALALTVLAAGAAAGVGHRVARSLWLSVPMAALVVVINALVNRNGLTVLARLGDAGPFGQLDITLEAIVYGARQGLVLIVIVAVFALASAALDGDEVLRSMRRLSLRSALTAAVATRMVPLLALDAKRIGEAQRCRPDPGGRLAVMRAITVNALDRSLDIAVTLEVRGYGTARRPTRVRRPWSRHDLAFAASERRDRRGVARAAGAVHVLPPDPWRPRGAHGFGCRGPRARRARAVRAATGDRPMSSALELERVSYRYPGARVPALTEISLELAQGEFAVLAGASASGKSTLLRIASGLVPHFHGGTFAGRAEICGMELRDHGPAELSRAVGTLFQDPETQVVMGTVRGELAFPLENRGESAVGVARGVEEVALALGIEALLDRATTTLSGGELQRVALGAALAGRPRLLLLDEPTSQLDPVAGDELLALLRRLNEEWGTAILLAEHRLERCLGAADRVIALQGGALACDADPVSFLAWAHDAAPALETPGAALIAGLGLRPPPAAVKQARATLRTAGLLPDPPEPARLAAPPSAPEAARPPRRRCACAVSGTSSPAGGRSSPGSRSRSRRGSASPCSAETAPASPRSCVTRPACSSPRAGASSVPAGSRCCCRIPATTSSRSASATRSTRPRSSARASRRSPIAIRATSPPASGSASRSRSSPTAPRSRPCCAWMSRRAGWTAPPRPLSPRSC